MNPAAAHRWKFYFVLGLTLVRVPLILVFLAITLLVHTRQSPVWFSIAFAAMILSAVTDLFDGMMARKLKVTSRLGAYADPLTDKIFYLTTFPTLVYLASLQDNLLHTRLLLGLAILFLMRDQWVTFLRSIGALYNVDAKANWSGKARTLISFPVICVVYYYLQAPPSWRIQVPLWVAYSLEVASLVINVISIWVYTGHYWPWIRREMQIPGTQDDSES